MNLLKIKIRIECDFINHGFYIVHKNAHSVIITALCKEFQTFRAYFDDFYRNIM